MKYFSATPRRRALPSVPRLSEHERRLERQALIDSLLKPSAGIVSSPERRQLPAAGAGVNPAPRSIEAMPRPLRDPGTSPLIIAVAGLLAAIALVVAVLAVTALRVIL